MPRSLISDTVKNLGYSFGATGDLAEPLIYSRAMCVARYKSVMFPSFVSHHLKNLRRLHESPQASPSVIGQH